MYYLNETYVHQNYAPNYSWCLKVEGNAVGTPAGKGQCLILQHTGGEQGWIAGVEQEKVCHALPEPLTFIMDNAAYHKVKQLMDEEKLIFDGWTFSKLMKAQLQHYLTAHQAEWGVNLKCNELYDLACMIYDKAPLAISEIVKRYSHEILFLPLYHSDFNPIENIWGIVKGYVACHHTAFTTAEIVRLMQEGVAHVTPEMWKKAIKKVEEMEELYLDDISDEIQ